VRLNSRAASSLLIAPILGLALLVFLVHGRSALAQTPQPATSAMTEVQQTIATARAEFDAYRTGGGKPGTPDHPAAKWQATLWEYRQRYPNTDASALATAEAIRLLLRAELSEQGHARVDSLDADDAAWVRVPSYLYDEASLRKDFAYAVAKFSGVAAATTSAPVKSAALLALGRAQRRQGDPAAATKTLEAARDAAPGTASAEDANGILYEIAHLSVGLPAPTFSAKGRRGGAVDLAGLHGRAVVLIFWAST
jgi:hypothetical protein